MAYQLIFLLNGLHLAEGDYDGLKPLKISDNKERRAHFFSTETVIEAVGRITAITTCADSAYIICSIDDTHDRPELRTIHKSAHTLGYIVASVINGFWFVKDNAISLCEIIAYDDKIPHSSFVASTSHLDTLANGEVSVISFSNQEIDEALKINKALNAIITEKPKRYEINEKLGMPRLEAGMHFFTVSPLLGHDYNDHNKIERALMFLDNARSQAYLPAKISFFIPVLECLFSTDNAELSYRVSERVAKYYGGGQDEMLSVFKTVRDAYNFRSSFFHGGTLSKYRKRDEQIELSTKLDNLLRIIIKRVILEDNELFLGSKDNFDEHFLKLVFESSSS